ncbi:MAG: GH32 C-terminal domain-containing protein [Actinomycetota bacterium]|nr:GH32 C-terminal domain-containing protein [Actinomycetota bacterium]
MNQPVLFRPATGWVGDVIPVERDGEFWLYFLHEQRDQPDLGTGWRLVRTRDFVQFEDDGVALPAGGPDEDDFNAYTGSVVVADDGTAHLFYTGQNPCRLGPDGAPVQLVKRATSSDRMRTWTKDPELTLGPPPGYESADWRDPFVFRPSPSEPWRMLVTARHDNGPERRRGVIAQYVSDNLGSWRPAEPFWDPRRYVAHECPDVFQWGNWWYLVYSEFSERFATHYRVARTPDGPWRTPELDTVDGRAFYAAKTVARDGRRFFVGWIATKAGESDDGSWEWAGDLSVLEAHQRPDGSLDFSIPAEVEASFPQVEELFFAAGPDQAGDAADTAKIRLATTDGYLCALTQTDPGAQFLARISLEIDDDTTEAGILIRSSPDGDASYCLRLEPRRQRMVLDRWPRRSTGAMQWQISGDVPHAVELERPCVLDPGVHQIDLLVEGSALVAVLDRRVVLSARMYDRSSGQLGVFVGEGSATFFNLTVATRTRESTETEGAT